MDLFRRRPLFCACGLYMAMAALGFFLHARGLWSFTAVLLLSVLVPSLTLAYALSRLWRRSYARGAAILLCTILPLLSIWQSYAMLEGGDTVTYLSAMEGQETTVEGTVTERRGSGGYMTTYALRFDSINGHAVKGSAILICHYVSDLQPGHAVTLRATVLPLDEAAGNLYDAHYLQGNGFSIGLDSATEADVTIHTEEGQKGNAFERLSLRMGEIRRSFAARLELLAGRDGKGLPSALLLGETGNLDTALRRDFSRTGTSHILSISGMHMVLLFGLLEGILRLLHVPRYARAVALGLSALAYLTLIGFIPSATRAAVMLGMTYLATLTSSRADPLTSLGLSGMLILAVTPWAVASAGFWMSFLATLGLVTLSPLIGEWLRAADRRSAGGRLSRPRRAWIFLVARLKALCLGLAVGMIAVSFTLFVVAAVIGELGLLSPVATLFLTPPSAVILLVSLLALPLGGSAIGPLLGRILSLMGRVMAGLTAWMAEPSDVVISLRHPAVLPVSILMVALTVLFLGLRLPRKRQYLFLLPVLVGWLTIGGITAVDDHLRASEVNVTFLQPSTQSDELILVSDHKAFICDMSNGSMTAIGGAMTEAHRRGATEISVLMLTHYHSRTGGTLDTVLNREKVRELWLPTPQTDKDYGHYLAYVEKAEAAGVPIRLYEIGERLVTPDGTALVLDTTSISRSVQPVLLLTLDTAPSRDGVGEITLCGSAVFESDLRTRAARAVATSSVVIFGNHGPLVKAPFGQDLIYASDGRSVTVIISGVGDISTYFREESFPANARKIIGEAHLTLARE